MARAVRRRVRLATGYSRHWGGADNCVLFLWRRIVAFSIQSVKKMKTWLRVEDAVRRLPLRVVPVSQHGTGHYYAHNRFFSLSLKFTGPWSAGPASWRNGSIQELFKLGEYA